MLPLLRIRWTCGSFGERHRSSRPSRRHEASWIRSRVPPEVNPLFFLFFFSAGLLLHKKLSDEVQYLPSDLECCYTRKQHRHQTFSLRKLLITALTRESWNDVTNRTRPRPNLIVFHSVMFQMGAFFDYFENSQKIEVATKWTNFCGILLSAI